MKGLLSLILAIFFSVNFCEAQIRITPTNIDDWIKKNFSGQGVIIGKVKHSGNQLSMASFTSSTNVLQIPKGLILSTGTAQGSSGVNNQYNRTRAFGDMKFPETDADISKIIPEKLYDISIIEFDFVPLANSLQFTYQFGSDEYPEYVGTVYNDVFAFFISDDASVKNIALIPSSSTPVSINTVNHKTNSEFFLDNNVFSETVIKRQIPLTTNTRKRGFLGSILYGIKSFFTPKQIEAADRVIIRPDPTLLKKVNQSLYRNLQYDGITKKLVAQAYVEPYKKYHLKIVIADVSDNIYDSGVFIENGSLTSKKDALQPGFVNYPDYSKVVDPLLILEGKKLEDIIPLGFRENQLAQERRGEIEKLAAANEIIYFDFDKSDITSIELNKIKRIAEIYSKIKDEYNIRIAGHTDSVGALDYNFDLSKRRNQAVIEALKELIKDEVKILSSTEKAYLQPVADNKTDDGRMRNRRVEIIFVKK